MFVAVCSRCLFAFTCTFSSVRIGYVGQIVAGLASLCFTEKVCFTLTKIEGKVDLSNKWAYDVCLANWS